MFIMVVVTQVQEGACSNRIISHNMVKKTLKPKSKKQNKLQVV